MSATPKDPRHTEEDELIRDEDDTVTIPEDLRYTEKHEWIRDDGNNVATVGITNYAQNELNDVVFVELPALATKLDRGDVFGAVDSCKTYSELYTPVSGEVVEVNTQLEGSPEWVNEDPYGNGWMIKMRLTDPSEIENLMDAEAYEAFVVEIERKKKDREK